MAGRDELALIAELGVGFVGFVAVFLIFARREGRFSPADGYRIRVIIIAGVSVIFLALLPLTANLYGLTGTTLWRSASILGLVTHVAAILHVAPKQRALSPEDRAELVGVIVPWGIALLTALIYVLNIAGIFHEPFAAPYLAALTCALGIGASNFVTIAFQRLL